MMQKEFEGLTGVIVSTSEYALIEKAYMDCEDDKKTFCRQWVKNGGANMLSKERLAEIKRLKAGFYASKRNFRSQQKTGKSAGMAFCSRKSKDAIRI